MDEIGDLLPKHITQPDEFAKIKSYVLDHFEVKCTVSSARNSIIVTVPDSAVAMQLRMNYQNFQTTCDIDPATKIVIRINPTI